jgi:hypothetical protein
MDIMNIEEHFLKQGWAYPSDHERWVTDPHGIYGANLKPG